MIAVKTWVVNPYRIPTASMEPTLHCARPGEGCEARFSDRVLANRFIYRFRRPHRGEIVVFNTPPAVRKMCGTGGTFVKRLIGLPGENVYEDEQGFLWVDGHKLLEPYVRPRRRYEDTEFRDETWHVAQGGYFFVGDNRGESCDSRRWGSVPRKDLIGPIFATYWPPGRISLRAMLPAAPFVGLLLVLPLRRRRRSGVHPSEPTGRRA